MTSLATLKKEEVISKKSKLIISIEAGIGLGWQKYTQNNDTIISIETFGKSAKGSEVLDKFGFSTDRICPLYTSDAAEEG